MTAEKKYQLICSECKNKFVYQNKTECPACETKINNMSEPLYLNYIYYHCTKRKTPSCPEKSIQEVHIDDSMAKYVENNLVVSEALSRWCISYLDDLAENDKKTEYERRAAHERTKAEKQKDYDELVRMRMKGLIDDDNEFLKLKATLRVIYSVRTRFSPT